jgi:hypothetical protein
MVDYAKELWVTLAEYGGPYFICYQFEALKIFRGRCIGPTESDVDLDIDFFLMRRSKGNHRLHCSSHNLSEYF